MTYTAYTRVIPRDLFNEGNLLKCLGQLYLKLEELGQEALLVHVDDTAPFRIDQDPASGAITVENVQLVRDGEAYHLIRPLNSRAPYPLYLAPCDDGDHGDDEEVPVFDDDGTLSLAMRMFLGTPRL